MSDKSIHDETEGLSDILNFLRTTSEALTDTNDDCDILSVRDAERAVEIAQIKGTVGTVARKVVRDVIEHEVSGSSSEYHNLITELMSAGAHTLAREVARKGLTLYPYSVDLLADAMHSAGRCGDFAYGDEVYAVANRIPRERWGWRLFLYAIDYLQAKFESVEPERAMEVYDEAIDVAHAFQTVIPDDERGFNKEAELRIAVNQTAEARRILEETIFGSPRAPQGLVAPQCCITLIDRVLDTTTEYGLIRRVAQRGLRNTTQEQPSARIGYFVYREALAMDAELFEAGRDDGFSNEARVRNVLALYQSAYALNQDSAYQHTIEERFAIVSSRSGITDMQLH